MTMVAEAVTTALEVLGKRPGGRRPGPDGLETPTDAGTEQRRRRAGETTARAECPVIPEVERPDARAVFGGELVPFADGDVRAIRIVGKVLSTVNASGLMKKLSRGKLEIARRVVVLSSSAIVLCAPHGPVKRFIELTKIAQVVTQELEDDDLYLLIQVPSEHDVLLKLYDRGPDRALEPGNRRSGVHFVETLKEVAAWKRDDPIPHKEIFRRCVQFSHVRKGMLVQLRPFSFHSSELKEERFWGKVSGRKTENKNRYVVMQWNVPNDKDYPGPPQCCYQVGGELIKYQDVKKDDVIELRPQEATFRCRGTVVDINDHEIRIDWDLEQVARAARSAGAKEPYLSPAVRFAHFDDRKGAQPVKKTRVERTDQEPEFWWDGPPHMACPTLQPGVEPPQEGNILSIAHIKDCSFSARTQRCKLCAAKEGQLEDGVLTRRLLEVLLKDAEDCDAKVLAAQHQNRLLREDLSVVGDELVMYREKAEGLYRSVERLEHMVKLLKTAYTKFADPGYHKYAFKPDPESGQRQTPPSVLANLRFDLDQTELEFGELQTQNRDLEASLKLWKAKVNGQQDQLGD